MKLSRLWVPATLLATALAIVIIAGGRQGVREPAEVSETTTAAMTPATEAREPIETDTQGRQVRELGTANLHIPPRYNPTGGAKLGWIRLGACFAKYEFNSKCTSFENQVFITISPGDGRTRFPYSDSREQLSKELTTTDGPFESEFDGVWEFRYRDSSRVFYYAIVEVDHTNRHVVAGCSNGPRCSVWVHVDPSISVRYEFDRKHLDQWPWLNKEITNLVASFLVSG